ncbi:MAG: helix-turn-helix transcriptional regulator [Fibrobacteres bacterium]|nr:helix-turn-helix transcriptional regulator [Fibrobacterota bacterium]
MNIDKIIGINIEHSIKRDNASTFFVSPGTKQKHSTMLTIILVEKGSIVMHFKNGHLTINRNELVIWNYPDLLEAHKTPGVTLNFRILSFDVFDASGNKTDLIEKEKPLFIKTKNKRKIISLMDKITATRQLKSIDSSINSAALGLRLLNCIYHETKHSNKENFQSKNNVLDYRIKEAVEYINKHYKEMITVEQLAKNAFMHPSSFSRLFNQQLGMPPLRYALEFKIRKAKDFILFFDSPLQFTALELGFHDYPHFSKVFKKIAGVSPLKFAKSNYHSYNPRIGFDGFHGKPSDEAASP